MSAKIQVDVGAHDDAVAVMERLGAYRPGLVQSASTRWCVQAEAPGDQGESIPEALAAIEETLAERQVEDGPVRVNGQLYSPPDSGGRRSAADANPDSRVSEGTTHGLSPHSHAEPIAPTRERKKHPLPHRPVRISSAVLGSLVRSSQGYDDLREGDVADFVQFSGRDIGAEAVVTFTRVIGKLEGTVSVLREYEDGGKVKIGTRQLAFRKTRLVYDPADPNGPDVGFLTAVGGAPSAEGGSAQPVATRAHARVGLGRTATRRRVPVGTAAR